MNLASGHVLSCVYLFKRPSSHFFLTELNFNCRVGVNLWKKFTSWRFL